MRVPKEPARPKETRINIRRGRGTLQSPSWKGREKKTTGGGEEGEVRPSWRKGGIISFKGRCRRFCGRENAQREGDTLADRPRGQETICRKPLKVTSLK